MKSFPDKSFDLVFTDPPYGTTGNEWDVIVDFWVEIMRISKGQIIFSAQPFTTDLINGNRSNFKYHWIWDKALAGNGILAPHQPLKVHEEVCIFGDVSYYPIMRTGVMRSKGGIKDTHGTFNGAKSDVVQNNQYYPRSILNFSGASMRSERVHPTQKPIELCKYLVQTYTNESDTILDPFMGSGTTLVAAKQLGRNATGIEISEKYCEIARRRLEQDLLF